MTEESDNFKWIMLALFWLLYFTFGMIRSAISPLIAPIAQELKLTNSQIGTILGIFMIAYVFLSIPIGIIIDKVGIKKSILIGVSLLTLSGILRSFATNYTTMLITVGLMGLGCPTISVGVPKAVATWFTGNDKGTATGIYVTGMTIGIATATAITTSILLPIMGTWRNTLLVYGLFSLLVTAAWHLFSKDAQTKGEKDSSESIKESLLHLLGNKQVLLLVVIGFFYMFVSYGMGGWLPRLLELKEITPSRAGLIASLPSWFGLVGSILLPSIGHRVKRKYVMFAALFLQGISIYMIGAGVGISLVVALILYGIMSMGFAPLMIVSFMDIPEVGAEYMGLAGGLWFSIGAIGGFLGPTIIGYLLDLTGSYFTGLLVMTAFIEAMTVISLLLKN
jgi:cyanate permease